MRQSIAADLEPVMLDSANIVPAHQVKRWDTANTAIRIPCVGPADSRRNDENSRRQSALQEQRCGGSREIGEPIVERERYGVVGVSAGQKRTKWHDANSSRREPVEMPLELRRAHRNDRPRIIHRMPCEYRLQRAAPSIFISLDCLVAL